MQVRKLVKSGYSSLVMAVPKEWVTKNKLKAGDLIYVDDEKEDLRISSKHKQEQQEKKEFVINVDGKNPRIIDYELNEAYLNNYYHIIIKGKDLPKVAKKVKETIVSLIALELIEESSEKIIARSFLNMYDVDLKSITRRMDNIIRSMIIDTKDCVKNTSLVENINNRDYEVNRLTFLVFKILKTAHVDKKILKSIDIQEMDVLKYWELTTHLEKIGDRVKSIARIIPKLNHPHQKKFIKLLIDIEGLYKNTMKAFYNNDKDLSDSVSIKRIHIIDEVKEYAKGNCNYCSRASIHGYNMISHINDIARTLRFLSTSIK
jgi:phosphate uptake regulator